MSSLRHLDCSNRDLGQESAVALAELLYVLSLSVVMYFSISSALLQSRSTLETIDFRVYFSAGNAQIKLLSAAVNGGCIVIEAFSF